MQLRLSGEFLARASAWLKTGAEEVDPHKITLLRNIEANGNTPEALVFAKRLGIDPADAVDHARALLRYSFARSMEASESAPPSAKRYVEYSPARPAAPRSAPAAVPAPAPPTRSAGEGFRIQRAVLENLPVVRKDGGKTPLPQIALKDPSGHLLVLEAASSDRVLVSFGDRADFTRGSRAAKDAQPVSSAQAAELLPWVRGAIARTPRGSPSELVLEALANTASARTRWRSSLSRPPADPAVFQRFLRQVGARSLPTADLWNAYAAGWSRASGVIPNLPRAEEWAEAGKSDVHYDELQEQRWRAFQVQDHLRDAPGDPALTAELKDLSLRIAFELWMSDRADARAFVQDESGYLQPATNELFSAFAAGAERDRLGAS